MQETLGAYTTHNTHDCCHYNKDGTPIKKSSNINKPHSKGNGTEGTDFAQLFHTEYKGIIRTAFKKANKSRKHQHLIDESKTDYNDTS